MGPTLAYTVGTATPASSAIWPTEVWGRLGRSSVAVIAVLFGLVNVPQVVLVAARSELAGDPALVTTLWALHDAVFTLNLLAVGGGSHVLVIGPAGFLCWLLLLATSSMRLLRDATGEPESRPVPGDPIRPTAADTHSNI